MTKLFSALAAAAIGLVGLAPAAPVQRERLHLARQRQAQHQLAIASGDLTRSPYHRFGGPAGQSTLRHEERSWHQELTNAC